ncbi:polyadenylate-binding protein-interacting protein 4-like [Durio zibethinus]|uniref:Polyadenylate-binding protein-interacting protein 4-like n=1 Tax=Durio zibethinus TaxID=66656 RepID=A0A6P5X185_DURZI|nr:polyadenylate-binding protein-interacting protein 4-like [Durio zibethinus]
MSSNSDCIGAVSASSGPGLSPSSSVGSLSSEKLTLNPYAKDSNLTPMQRVSHQSQMPVQPPSPLSDGSFSRPTQISPVPHMQMPVSFGVSYLKLIAFFMDTDFARSAIDWQLLYHLGHFLFF